MKNLITGLWRPTVIVYARTTLSERIGWICKIKECWYPDQFSPAQKTSNYVADQVLRTSCKNWNQLVRTKKWEPPNTGYYQTQILAQYCFFPQRHRTSKLFSGSIVNSSFLSLLLSVLNGSREVHGIKQGGVSHCGIAIYVKKYLKAKEDIWKLKFFTMQKYNLQKNLQKKPKYFKIL